MFLTFECVNEALRSYSFILIKIFFSQQENHFYHYSTAPFMQVMGACMYHKLSLCWIVKIWMCFG